MTKRQDTLLRAPATLFRPLLRILLRYSLACDVLADVVPRRFLAELLRVGAMDKPTQDTVRLLVAA